MLFWLGFAVVAFAFGGLRGIFVVAALGVLYYVLSRRRTPADGARQPSETSRWFCDDCPLRDSLEAAASACHDCRGSKRPLA